MDWYPWGEEGLGRARAEDKPILLSIGYSACHWCHVMEKESFEDEATAALLNERFVSIKVDREERPDLDHIYQLVVQLMGRSGGWPLTVFLTPDQRPFFAGTYFPPEVKYGMPSFRDVLTAVSDAFRDKRGEIDAQAADVTRGISSALTQKRRDVILRSDLLETAGAQISRRFDDEHGGFGGRPKFPSTMSLTVLLHLSARGDEKAGARVKKALTAMRHGGIWDQLRGGFHRYSTDERWLVPHFEKMLYDNALLLGLYVEAFRLWKEPLFADTARELVAYVLAEMTDGAGGFYSTQDADSEGEEGKFFVFSPAELADALGGDDVALRVLRVGYDVTDEGNFEETGKTVLSQVASPAEVAHALGLAEADASAAWERGRAALLRYRETRPRPHRDEKILASWNGLMIAALAEAGAALGEKSWIVAAKRAFVQVERALFSRDGDTLRVERLVKGDRVRGPGFLDDYAFLGDAAVTLYEVTGELSWLAVARELGDATCARFLDPEHGFFFSPKDGEALVVRPQDAFDNAIPSGTSMACQLLLRLGTLVDAKYTDVAERELRRLAASALESPAGFAQTLLVLDRLVRASVDVVVVGQRGGEATEPFETPLARAIFETFVPHRALAWVDPEQPETAAAVPALAAGKSERDGTVAYVCRGRACSLPIAEPSALTRELGTLPS